MKINAYIMLHYGSEYLDACIRSIDPVVDQINIVYQEAASHQRAPKGAICPDSVFLLKNIAKNASNKIKWHIVSNNTRECDHLQEGLRRSDGCDLYLRMDADEVWEPNSLQNCIDQAANTDSMYIGIVGFVNFWRSFDHAVFDRFGPIRIHNMKSTNKAPKMIDGTMYHFGYAINEATMKYKLLIHGHKDEWRAEWHDRWLKWTPETVGENWHPTTDAYWHKVEPFDKTILPDYLKTHPYYNVPIIR